MLIYYFFDMTYFKVVGKTKSCAFKMAKPNIWKIRKYTSEIFNDQYQISEVGKMEYKQFQEKYMI